MGDNSNFHVLSLARGVDFHLHLVSRPDHF